MFRYFELRLVENITPEMKMSHYLETLSLAFSVFPSFKDTQLEWVFADVAAGLILKSSQLTGFPSYS